MGKNNRVPTVRKSFKLNMTEELYDWYEQTADQLGMTTTHLMITCLIEAKAMAIRLIELHDTREASAAERERE